MEGLDTSRDTTIGQLVDTFGTHTFGATMLLFAAPNLVPNPPGTSPILGLPLLIIAGQLMLGRRTVWLPDWLRKRPVSRHTLSILSKRVSPLIIRIEKALKPRLAPVVSSGGAMRLIGLAALPLAGILLLPLPFLHMLPGAAMTAFAIGLAEEDGWAVLIGYALALATLVLTIVLGLTVHAGFASVF